MTEEDSGSTKALAVAVLVVIVVLAILFYRFSQPKPQPKTVEELLAVAGNLPEDQGYMYNGIYPFVYIDGFWYTQIKSPQGTKLFELPFRYGPRDTSNVTVSGNFNETFFNENRNVFVTFDPIGNDLTHILLAVGDFDAMIVKVFGKIPLAACTRNETLACANRPIITCENSPLPVVYFRSSDEAGVFMSGNCIILSGREFDIVRSTDRFLLGIMDIAPW
ncbi:hypothetical protein HY638_02000 [Candidatus Woesearchaeota archaeon]|nr:hypothetical protein [Candidatus Woesearchaeota archaeon]